ncbi:hypothetical protein ACO0KY_15210 [Undibacterium sp. Dicai25W]|uniref:hypothetical protein n=1 Tax=Undibacterium sp. Dicai25W TaxID=3413034 RepID=UPI003BEF737B
MNFNVIQTKFAGVIDRRFRIMPVLRPIFPETPVRNEPLPTKPVTPIRFHHM